jgi:NAD(P)H-dependent FMN reductase
MARPLAKWVYEIAQKRSDAEFELVDIEDFNLPLLDEPVPRSMGQYSKPHTKVWAAKIGSFDGYVFRGYKAALLSTLARTRTLAEEGKL